MAQQKQEAQLEETAPRDVYYFAYGPVCNEMVRKRRGIECTEIKAAYVPDYRLTFAFGGNANILSKTGFEAHGLLMKLKSPEDWEKVKKFEAGNTPTIRTVVPYDAQSETETDSDSHNADDDFLSASTKGAIKAYLIEMPEDADHTLLDAPIERLPQERYLKLIARGMKQYGVDEDYVTDHIEACPFIPTRKQEDYVKFPIARKIKKISLNKYRRLCARASVEGDLYFVLGKRVFLCWDHDPENPLAKWFEANGHGKEDCTYMVHLTVVDPDIPLIYNAQDATPLHIAWAENHLVEVMEQYGMGGATLVYELADDSKCLDGSEEDNSSVSSSVRRSCWKCVLCPFRGRRDEIQ